MPPKRGRGAFRPRRTFPSRSDGQNGRLASGVVLERRVMPQPESSTSLRALLSSGEGGERWELICRDGWEWQRASSGAAGAAGTPAGGRPLVWVRSATLSADQAAIVRDWIERIRTPAVWWEVSRALQTPEGSATVSRALDANPWLRDVLLTILEASAEGAPPPPPG